MNVPSGTSASTHESPEIGAAADEPQTSTEPEPPWRLTKYRSSGWPENPGGLLQATDTADADDCAADTDVGRESVLAVAAPRPTPTVV